MSCLVSVVIVNYNTRDLLRDCLLSVRRQTKGVDIEIVVVDNASVDGSCEMLAQEFPEVCLVASPENLGFGRANNLGVEETSGEYVFFLNSDTLLVNDAVTVLCDFMRNNPRMGICGGVLYDLDMRPNLSVVDPPSEWDEYRRMLPRCLRGKEGVDDGYHGLTEPEEVECVTGADLMMRRDVFYQAGGFDPDFFLYAEEVELTHRVKRLGYSVFIVPRARIIHLEGKSAKSPVDNQRVYEEKWFSKWLYFWKVYGRRTVSRVHWVHAVRCEFAYRIYALSPDKAKRNYWAVKRRVVRSSYRRFVSLLRTRG